MKGEIHLDPRDADHADFPVRKLIDPQYEFTIFFRGLNYDAVARNREFMIAYGRRKYPIELLDGVAHIPFKNITLIDPSYQKPVSTGLAGLAACDRWPDRNRVTGF